MGKHRGQNGDKPGAPFGNGPHPTPKESEEKGKSFDRQWEYNKARGEGKKK